MSDRIRFGEIIEPEAPAEHLPPVSLLAREAGNLRNAPFQVYMTQDVYAKIWSHINQTPNIESGGVLVGYPFKTPDNAITFVVITAAIPQHSNNRSVGHFTVGPAEINAARLEMEQKYPGLITVGWYHSHPGHGIFLSAQDMTIVRSIYNISWHIALVLDPLQRLEGVFVGPDGARLRDAQSGQSWLGLKEAPDSVKAIALYNRTREALNSRQPLPARRLLGDLQRLAQTSEQLAHWRNGYRDAANLQKPIDNDLAANPQLNNTHPLPQLPAPAHTAPPLPAQATHFPPSPPSPVSHAASSSAVWWLGGAGTAALLFAIFIIPAILYPQITGPVFVLGNILLGLLAIIVAGYVIASQNISFVSPDGAQQHKSPVYSKIERIWAWVLITLVVLVGSGYVLFQSSM